jgi:hypothetical protein
MRERGFEESRDGCLEHMALLAYPQQYQKDAVRYGLGPEEWDLIVNYFESAVAAIEDLESSGDLSYMIMESFRGDANGLPPWFQTEPDPLTYGRLLAPTPSDEESAAAAGDSLAVFTARAGGVTAANESAAAMRSHGAAQGDGTDLVRQLLRAARRYGATIALNHRVTDIVTADGAVVGVIAETPEGPVTLEARRGVVFASGGFEHNADLRERFLRGPIVGTCGVGTNRGDFISIAERVDIAMANTREAWWAELPLEPCLESFEQGDLMSQVYGDSTVVVNTAGVRVVNEKLLYNERGKIHFVKDEAGDFPNYLLFQIFDDAIVQDDTAWTSRWPVPRPGETPSYVLKANTLDELSGALAARLEKLSAHTGGVQLSPDFTTNLTETVRLFNGYAEAGSDPEFHRGEKLTDRYFSVDIREHPAPNNSMYPFSEVGPYYAVILGASCLGTKGGPKINPKSQVLRPDGSVVPGLYGAGNCIASPAGEAYWGGGSTLGPAIVHGYLAGQNVMKEPARSLAGSQA